MPHKPLTAVLLALLFLGCSQSTAPPIVALEATEGIVGRVVGISDGDTIKVLVDKQEVKIRLHGIDCPETGQPFGKAAKQFTSAQCFGKDVVVEVIDIDRYKRTVGVVLLLDGTIVNHEIVRAGLAWWYKQYAPVDETIEGLEKEAKEAKRGLWADKNPIPPWDWRKGKRPEGTPVTYWLSETGKRHNNTCKYYRNCKGRECGSNEGTACKVCGG